MKKVLFYIFFDIIFAAIILACFALSFFDLSILFPEESSIELTATKQPVYSPVSTSTPAVDELTEWQEKFRDRFSDTVKVTDTTYKSPNISVELSTHQYSNGQEFTYHIADIYISCVDCFKTFTTGHDTDSNGTYDILSINSFTDAIVSINGDTCSIQDKNFFIRNGTLFMNGVIDGSELIMYKNGEMRIADKSVDTKDSLLSDSNIYQVWHFGPSLLDADGNALHPPIGQYYICLSHPRTAIGYFEPGHYCFVVVDGRTNGSTGCYLEPLAEIFEDLGCKIAYNLDGGASSMLAFNGNLYSTPCDGIEGGLRKLSDTIYITEP